MLIRTAALLILIAAACLSPRGHLDDVYYVSLSTLLATANEYPSGQRIVLYGFLARDFNDVRLYLTEAHAVAGDYAASIGLASTDPATYETFRECAGHFVEISGRYEKFAGDIELTSIRRIVVRERVQDRKESDACFLAEESPAV
ncbi:MAG: hypothetical protein ACX98W_08430 [bacterium]